MRTLVRCSLVCLTGLFCSTRAGSSQAPGPGTGPRQEPVDFTQVTRPVVEISDPETVERLLFELFMEPVAPPDRVQVMDVTQNGFGPGDLIIAYPSAEVFLVPEFLPQEVLALMSSWEPDVEYRLDSGNIPLEALAALIQSDPDETRQAERGIMYQLVEAVERSYRDLPVGLLFRRDSLGFTFQLWDYNQSAMQYTPSLPTANDETVIEVVEMLRDIGYVPGVNVTGTGRELPSDRSVASVDQTLFGIGGVPDEQVRLLAVRTVLLGSYDLDRSGALDRAGEVDAVDCRTWEVLEEGFPGFLDRYGFTEARDSYLGSVLFSIGDNVRQPVRRRMEACLAGTPPPPTSTEDVAPPARAENVPAPVQAQRDRGAAVILLQRGGSQAPGTAAWFEAVRETLLDRYDQDRSGSLDSLAEVRAVPCEAWLALEATHPEVQNALTPSWEDQAGVGSLGIHPDLRTEARDRAGRCLGTARPTEDWTTLHLPREAATASSRPGAAPDLRTSLEGIQAIPGEEERRFAAKTLLLAAFDEDGSGQISSIPELSAIPCSVWTALEVAFPDYATRFGLVDPTRPYLGNTMFSIAEPLRPGLRDALTACLAGDPLPRLDSVAVVRSPVTLRIPLAIKEFLDAQVAARIWEGRPDAPPGSAGWVELVRQTLLEQYDLDGSGSVDRTPETRQIPCVVWSTVAATSAGVLPALGFRGQGDYLGDTLGLHREQRAQVVRALTECGVW